MAKIDNAETEKEKFKDNKSHSLTKKDLLPLVAAVPSAQTEGDTEEPAAQRRYRHRLAH